MAPPWCYSSFMSVNSFAPATMQNREPQSCPNRTGILNPLAFGSVTPLFFIPPPRQGGTRAHFTTGPSAHAVAMLENVRFINLTLQKFWTDRLAYPQSLFLGGKNFRDLFRGESSALGAPGEPIFAPPLHAHLQPARCLCLYYGG